MRGYKPSILAYRNTGADKTEEIRTFVALQASIKQIPTILKKKLMLKIDRKKSNLNSQKWAFFDSLAIIIAFFRAQKLTIEDYTFRFLISIAGEGSGNISPRQRFPSTTL